MIHCKGIRKSFGEPATHVLKGIDLDIQDGELVSITGRSGSGKSTLLYILSSLDQPTDGVVEIDGRNIASLDEKHLHEMRNREIGFVFQFHYLLPELTTLENVLMPARKAKQDITREKFALDLLDRFGLKAKAHRYSGQLSGGEQQRVAIARSLVMEPRYIFADEPTGNLDSVNGAVVLDIFKEVNRTKGTTVIYVTHDAGYASQASRQIHLIDGTVQKVPGTF
jgi:putative ABC transport system ATP-binding protein/lipoprotein-releasing system ATP-binding protein